MAPWAPACAHLAPVFAELAQTYGGDALRWGVVDVGAWPSLAKQHNILTTCVGGEGGWGTGGVRRRGASRCPHANPAAFAPASCSHRRVNLPRPPPPHTRSHAHNCSGQFTAVPSVLVFEGGKEAARVPVVAADGQVQGGRMRRRNVVQELDLDRRTGRPPSTPAPAGGKKGGDGSKKKGGGSSSSSGGKKDKDK